MSLQWMKARTFGKKSLLGLLGLSCLTVAACSVNPATGDRQFTALLPTEKEAAIGAQEHKNVEKSFGKFMTGPLADYVSTVGAKIAVNTERKDVQYKFHVIDSPIVNAFAIPGGYVYVSRGLLALANSEAELAGVLAHEVGHITARHAAERVSQGFLVNLGAAVIGAAAGSADIGRAAGLGSELYIKSYSRGQELESDTLGVRYLSRAGYDTNAMAGFLRNLDAQTKLDAKLSGKKATSDFNYFSTHPITSQRVTQASAEALTYPKGKGTVRRDAHLQKVNGMTYGDSADQGFVRGNNFYHTGLGFMFSVPKGTKISNSQAAVMAKNSNGTVIVFDMGKVKEPIAPLDYIKNVWLKNQTIGSAESIKVNGLNAATAAFTGVVQGKSVTIRLVAIEWKPGEFFRFQMAIPKSVNAAFMDELKKTTYSFRRLSTSEKNSIRPKRIKLIAAKSGDSVKSLGARMKVDELMSEQFMVLNGLTASDNIVAGRLYKIIAD
jgi:predicted Zn-dependent protease